MERIKLTKEEKAVLLHVKQSGEKQPKGLSPAVFHYSLSSLQEKGLVKFIANYEEILAADITIKGAAYLEQNPKLSNPIDWIKIITLIMTIITALATTLALFIACSIIK